MDPTPTEEDPLSAALAAKATPDEDFLAALFPNAQREATPSRAVVVDVKENVDRERPPTACDATPLMTSARRSLGEKLCSCKVDSCDCCGAGMTARERKMMAAVVIFANSVAPMIICWICYSLACYDKFPNSPNNILPYAIAFTVVTFVALPCAFCCAVLRMPPPRDF